MIFLLNQPLGIIEPCLCIGRPAVTRLDPLPHAIA